MQDPPGTIAPARELLVLSLAGLALAILMTWPLAGGIGHLGRTSSTDADGQLSIWNISWVALTLNVVMLVAFASAFVCAYLLLVYLTDDRGAAAAAAIVYAFCPYVMSHLS